MADVKFTNSYTNKIYVAYMRLDRACGDDCGDPWNVLGWINLSPGETQTRPNPTNNRWFYYYAEADDGSFWAGEFLAEVRRARFEKCTCIGVSVSHGPHPITMSGCVNSTLMSSGASTLPHDVFGRHPVQEGSCWPDCSTT